MPQERPRPLKAARFSTCQEQQRQLVPEGDPELPSMLCPVRAYPGPIRLPDSILQMLGKASKQMEKRLCSERPKADKRPPCIRAIIQMQTNYNAHLNNILMAFYLSPSKVVGIECLILSTSILHFL